MMEIATDARGLPERLDALDAPELRDLSTSLRQVTALVDKGEFWGMDLKNRIERLGSLGKQVEKRTDAIAKKSIMHPLTWWIRKFDPTQRRDIEGVLVSAYGIAANLQQYAAYGRRTGLTVESMDLSHTKNALMELDTLLGGARGKTGTVKQNAKKITELYQHLSDMYEGESAGLIARRAQMPANASYSQKMEFGRLENTLAHVKRARDHINLMTVLS